MKCLVGTWMIKFTVRFYYGNKITWLVETWKCCKAWYASVAQIDGVGSEFSEANIRQASRWRSIPLPLMQSTWEIEQKFYSPFMKINPPSTSCVVRRHSWSLGTPHWWAYLPLSYTWRSRQPLCSEIEYFRSFPRQIDAKMPFHTLAGLKIEANQMKKVEILLTCMV